eukprot:CAMPEP_0197827432 /NCGR_PEP_ID=MMETSP1437-20131217/4203_1 /TAXON_ID=49252 ORGANISM="Eucampia antarctica, Strain CCMP1452" /NCGR_SAMPLE_ID=MMETSP1437 /ASSEMBLY_ACC=CAM_ASM_001096 /LENGTH=674 /DNA_ID=CAMNT_0043428261 /DNA_START=448 /DNA_END=2472 /DNA_ORIENTATION=+
MEELTTTDKNDAVKSSTEDPKLEKLRAKMAEVGVDAYIVPTDDPHLCEYVPAAYARRAFLSNFKGSAGTALVTADSAYLWTDSRYFNEASLQIDADHWELMKSGLPKVPSITKFLGDLAVKKYNQSKLPFRLGIDAYVHPASFAKELADRFEAAKDHVEQPTNDDDSSVEDSSFVVGEIDTLDNYPNLVDFVWADDRPAVPKSPFRVHPIEYAGKSVADKIEIIRETMRNKKATFTVFSALDDIAYLFNMRATGDIATCPVGIAYATISNNEVFLYCDEAKVVSDDVQSHLKEAGVTVKLYDDIVPEMEAHMADTKNAKIWIEKARSNYALSRIIPVRKLIDAQNAVTPMKACKNEAEMEGMRRAHIVDGVAMAHFIAWLQNVIVNEGRSVSEVEIDEVLTGYRAKQPGFVEVSFPTIAGVGPNGAIIHYSAKKDSDLLKYLDITNPILIDSGGQYKYGTTDVTRTWHFGEATSEFIDAYTRVLKGNIGVDSMIYPEDTPGFVLDVFARKSLWEGGLDYGHGTGHGVGAALNVHEGPQSISPRWANKEVLKKGMVLSNEPGYYVDGKFGIRIENLLEVSYVNDEDNEAYDQELKEGDEGFPEKPVGQRTFLKFRRLTMIPIQKNLIDVSMLNTAELDWLDSYHEEVYAKVAPLLENDSPAMVWLKKSCEKIERN